jgi:hypothetical protein
VFRKVVVVVPTLNLLATAEKHHVFYVLMVLTLVLGLSVLVEVHLFLLATLVRV